MAELKFNQKELVNLEYSLSKEFISTNRVGGYMSSTITCCNTRKYHGLVVCPKNETDDENYVFLSSLDETVIQKNKEFNLAVHKFNDSYEPKGYKYLTDFFYSPTPTIVYRVGGVEMKKELLWLHNRRMLMIKYTLCEANSPTILRIKPFMAFRSVDALSKANMMVSGLSVPVKNGVKNKLYDGLPSLYFQLNTENEFVPAPDWYYDFEYPLEEKRGCEYREDLFTTGFFEFDIKPGQSVIMTCSFEEIDPNSMDEEFEKEICNRNKKTEFVPCLEHSARQFFITRNNTQEFIAGYHWYKERPRDLFIGIIGCALSQGLIDECVNTLDNQMSKLNNGLFSDKAVDTPLWFFVTLQNLVRVTSEENVWNKYSTYMKSILTAYKNGIHESGIVLHENGLVFAKKDNVALTWMDSYLNGIPVNERAGYQVEVNALWYNAVCFMLNLAGKFDDNEFVSEWKDSPELTKKSFLNMFWCDKGRYLVDSVYEGVKNTQIRPNQIIACGLSYIMLDDILVKEVIGSVEKHLLTPKGLRTLSPNDLMFKSECSGSIVDRNIAYHNGTVWSWLLLYYLVSIRKMHGDNYKQKVTGMIHNFEEDFCVHGIGTISEMCDGVPPYTVRGAVSFAMSVGAMLRMVEIAEYK